MVSRLHPTTRFLYCQVTHVLRDLGAAALGSPTLFELLYPWPGQVLYHRHVQLDPNDPTA